MSSSWVNYLGDDLLNNGWISSVLNFTEENKITVLTLIFFILAVALATRNPAEIHRRGIWIIPVDFPWTWRALHSGKLSVINALKQQTWQVIAAGSEHWSVFHDNRDYLDRTGHAFKFSELKRHSLPFAWGYKDKSVGSRPSPVNLMADGVYFLSVERGRVEGLFDKERERIHFKVKAKLFTCCIEAPRGEERNVLDDVVERNVSNDSGQSSVEDTSIPASEVPPIHIASPRSEIQFEWNIEEHPIRPEKLVKSWADALFVSTVIIAMWMLVAIAGRTGYGCIGLGLGITAFGFVAKQVIIAFHVGKDDTDVLNVLGECGKRIMQNESLQMVGGGLLFIQVRREEPNAPEVQSTPPESRSPEATEAIELQRVIAKSSESKSTVPAASVEETVVEERWTSRELQVQWRKPLRPPHCPWFGVFLGPLFPDPLHFGIVYSLILFLSGTVSPPLRSLQWSFMPGLAGVVVVGLAINYANGDPRKPLFLLASGTLILSGVSLRILVSLLRTYYQHFSSQNFEQVAGTSIAVGSWLLAPAIFPPLGNDTLASLATNSTISNLTNAASFN